eukprot:403339662
MKSENSLHYISNPTQQKLDQQISENLNLSNSKANNSQSQHNQQQNVQVDNQTRNHTRQTFYLQQRQSFLQQRDFVLDCTKVTQPKLPSYNGLYDKHLVGFFERSQHRKHLYINGVIDREGRIVDPNIQKAQIKRFKRESFNLNTNSDNLTNQDQSHIANSSQERVTYQNLQSNILSSGSTSQFKRRNPSILLQSQQQQVIQPRSGTGNQVTQLVYFSQNSAHHAPNKYLTRRIDRKAQVPSLNKYNSQKYLLHESKSQKHMGIGNSNNHMIESTASSENIDTQAIKIHNNEYSDAVHQKSKYQSQTKQQESNDKVSPSKLDKLNTSKQKYETNSNKNHNQSNKKPTQQLDKIYIPQSNHDAIKKLLDRKSNQNSSNQVFQIRKTTSRKNLLGKNFQNQHLFLQNQTPVQNYYGDITNNSKTQDPLKRVQSAKDLKPMSSEDFQNFLSMFKSKVSIIEPPLQVIDKSDNLEQSEIIHNIQISTSQKDDNQGKDKITPQKQVKFQELDQNCILIQ